jgi:SAM-dependent methyltransferase
MLAEAQDPGVPAWLRESLTRLAGALELEESSLVSLFAPMAQVSRESSASSVMASLIDSPLDVVKYAEHLFRDWVWGDDENARTLGLITPLIPNPCPRLAVFGAGTGRLAIELARRGHAEQIYAFDLNPLPFLVADRLLSGEDVELPEFPLAPLSETCAAVPRQLKLDGPRPPGLQLFLADALDVPFEEQIFDAVLTPWFIDDLPVDVGHTARVVNRALKPGGVWLNVGPLMFRQDLVRTCSIERVHELAREAGFEILHASAQDLPYFDSPVSSTRRIDRTYSFSARKIAESPAVTPAARGNAAFHDLMRPVPVTPALASAVQRAILTAGIASLVDGQRTLADIALGLSGDWNVDASELLTPLGEFLAGLSG